VELGTRGQIKIRGVWKKKTHCDRQVNPVKREGGQGGKRDTKPRPGEKKPAKKSRAKFSSRGAPEDQKREVGRALGRLESHPKLPIGAREKNQTKKTRQPKKKERKVWFDVTSPRSGEKAGQGKKKVAKKNRKKG